MTSSTETLIAAMRILARDTQFDDGVANLALAEAADRLEELQLALQNLVQYSRTLEHKDSDESENARRIAMQLTEGID